MSFVPVVDLSYYQGSRRGYTVDFNAVAASGVYGAILRSGDGMWDDPDFPVFAQNAHAAGLKLWAYHFVRLGQDPAAQGTHFTQRVRTTNLPFEGGLIGDFEDTTAGAGPVTVPFGDAYFGALDTFGRAGIYSAAWWWNPHVLEPERYAARFNVLAQYPSSQVPPAPPLWADWAFAKWSAGPTIPRGLNHWDGWQFSSNGAVPGITGRVDCNIIKKESLMPDPVVNAPVVAVIGDATSYRIFCSDGGVFCFGTASFLGSAAGVSHTPIVSVTAWPTGYRMVAHDGGVFDYGDAQYAGRVVYNG